jgi:uncharacterized protein YlaN (UPF0358 family)
MLLVKNSQLENMTQYLIPEDACNIIFSYLDSISICRCALVCICWSEIAYTNITSFDIEEHLVHINKKHGKQLLHLMMRNLNNLHSFFNHITLRSTTQDLITLLTSITRLEHLHLQESTGVNLLELMPYIGKLEQLTSFTISNSGAVHVEHLLSFLQKTEMRNLTSIHFNRCANLALVEYDQIAPLLANAPALTNISFFRCKPLPDTIFPPLMAMNNLKSIKIINSISLNGNVNGTGFPSLQELDLSTCMGLRNLNMITPITTLISLSLQDCYRIPILDFSNLTTLVNLEELNVSGTLINEDGLSDILQTTPKLTCLDLSDCECLNTLAGFTYLPSLTELSISENPFHVDLNVLGTQVPNLKILYCVNTDDIHGFSALTRLETLYTANAKDMLNLNFPDSLKYIIPARSSVIATSDDISEWKDRIHTTFHHLNNYADIIASFKFNEREPVKRSQKKQKT